MQLREFRPSRLLAALETIRRQHPNSANHVSGPDQSILDYVRQLLVGSESSDLAQVARDLKPPELRAALYLLATDDEFEVRTRAAQVVLARERADLLRNAWTFLCNYYPADPLESVVREMGSNLGWEKATSDSDLSARLPEWFAATRLPVGLLQQFVAESTQDLQEWLEDCNLDERHGLTRGTWAIALTMADKGLIARIGHETLLRRAQGSRQAIQEAFCMNYLIALGERSLWKQPVLEWIKSKFDKPSRQDEGLTPFWRSIPESVREQYRRWVNEATIRDFFESASDHYGRFAFWQQLVRHVVDARMALYREAMLMDFGSFGVVEFAEIGNAAYLYPPDVFARVWSRASLASSPGDLKERAETLRGSRGGPTGDGRIIHTGGWQYRYQQWIHNLIGIR